VFFFFVFYAIGPL